MNPPRGRDGVRPRFCFLLASLHTGASVDLWRGVADEAARRDIDLLVLPAGRIGATEGHEGMRNRLTTLARASSADGVLSWASSLTGFCGPGALEAIHEAMAPLPIVTLAQAVGGAPSVTVDAYGGMKSLLDHLADAHGFQRLAFIRGPASHPSAADRYRAYLDFLARRGLPFDPALVSSPLPWDEGGRAVAEFIDERGLDPGRSFQAAVAASDLLAFWFLRGLEGRGYRVPADVAVVGFNDSPESRLLAPPLTTVAMPFAEQGRRGLAMLAEYWETGIRPDDEILPASLVVRESCGCPSMEVARAGRSAVSPREANASASASAGAIVPERDRGSEAAPSPLGAADAVLRKAVEELGVERGLAEAWVRPLAQAFRDEGGPAGGRFLSTLERILDRSVREQSPGVPWQDVISSLEASTDGRDPTRASLVSKARVMIGQAAYRRSDYRQWAADEEAKRIKALGDRILTSYSIEGIAEALAEELPAFGFEHAYLIAGPNREGGYRLRLALRDGERLPLPAGGPRCATLADLAPEFLPQGRHTLSAEPLFVGEAALGCLVIDAACRGGSLIEEIRAMVATAVNGARLFAEAEEAKARAEKSDSLKTRLLANVGHELRAPLGLIADESRELSDAYPDDARLAAGLSRIEGYADHEARVVSDLLDISRADIGELDLSTEWIDLGALSAECVRSYSGDPALAAAAPKSGAGSDGPAWSCEVPSKVPWIRADPVRVRQILINLLDNARKHTERGSVRVALKTEPPWLSLEVADTGSGIDPELAESLFEPFSGDGKGVGLGLAISKRLASLMGGRLEAKAGVAGGSRFILRLPLPTLSPGGAEAPQGPNSVIWLGKGGPPPGLAKALGSSGAKDADGGVEFSSTALGADSDEGIQRAIAFDPGAMDAEDWARLGRMRARPSVARTPLLLYGQEAGPGLGPSVLLSAMLEGRPDEALALLGAPILAVDDDPAQRSRLRALLTREFPDAPVVEAGSAGEARAVLERCAPAFVVLDLGLPDGPGESLLDYMKSEERLRHVPAIVLTGRVLAEEELARIGARSRVAVVVKGVLSERELAGVARAALRDEIPVGSPAVKKALARLQSHYAGPMTRSSLAEAVGVNEDHLSRLFHRELGIGIWDFLNRFRIAKAKELLSATSMPVSEVAAKVGFSDPSYFCRVFRKLSGLSPHAYRESPASR